MAVSNRIKRNISFLLTLLGCVIIISWIVTPILARSIDAKGWFEIFGACVITYNTYSSFATYNKRVKAGIEYGK